MSSIAELMRRIATMLRRDEMERGLDEEMQFHIEQQTQKNIAQGMDPAVARRAAEQRFGGVDHMKESTRDEFRPAIIEDTFRDLRYGIRTLFRAPGFALVSILTLGLGIGAATAVFSVVNGVLLKPLPYPQPDRIVRLFEVNKDGNPMPVAHLNFADWQAQTHTFEHMAEMAQYGRTSVLAGANASQPSITAVSRDFFDVMRTHPAYGRGFAPEDHRESAAPVAIVSDAFWRTQLGGQRLNGQTVRFDNQTYQVVGVMPAGFDYPGTSAIWMPSELDRPAVSRTAHNYSVVARIAPNTTVQAAAADLSVISKRLKAAYGGDTWMLIDSKVVPLRENLTSASRPTLLVLMGAAAFLLIIACANVSSLLLARAATRQRELAVRLAMGAGRVAVVRQLMAESLVLCVAGGALGVFIASTGLHALLAYDPGALPRVEDIRIDWVALMFACAVSLGTAILLGLGTAARSGARDLRSLISNDGRTLTGSGRTQRVRDALVIAQVALTIVLLVAAGLLSRSFVRVLQVDPGFNTDNALIMDIARASAKNASQMQQQVQFQSTLMQQLQRLPGVTNVGIINGFPLGGGNHSNGQFIEMSSPTEIQSYEDLQKLTPADVQQRAGEADFRIASDDYFRAMSIPIIKGRGFQDSDAPDGPEVALISESLAKAKWPGRDPIGRYIQFGNMDGDMHALRIVGIVGDVREFGPEALPSATLYANYRQRPASIANFSAVVRGPDPATITHEAQQIVRKLDPQLPVTTRTMRNALDATFAGRRFSLLIIGMFGAVALVLATLGLYGVISYLVAQRTREIGIRTVLGAPRGTLMTLVIAKAARLAIAGMLIGAFGAAAFARLLQGLLYGGVSATDPAALAGVIIIVALAVLAATAMPVRRALRISPMMALRDE